MNLSNLSRDDLLAHTQTLVNDERRITTAILWHLLEIERRHLFADLGYSSLYDYCVRSLKYSEGAAYRRISAMRLLRDLPEVETKLATGTLTVSAAAKLQGALTTARRYEKKTYSADQKRELVEKLVGKSTLECERVLTSVLTRPAPQQTTRPIDDQFTELRITVDAETLALLKRVQELAVAKLHGKSDYGSLLMLMATLALETLEPKQPTKKVVLPSPAKAICPVPAPAKATRYVPALVKQTVWKRDQGRCTYSNPATGRRCESRWGLEIDHVVPFAVGGKSTVENLRLVCKTHNQHYARQAARILPLGGVRLT